MKRRTIRLVFSLTLLVAMFFVICHMISSRLSSDQPFTKFSEEEKKIKITLAEDKILADYSDSFTADGSTVTIHKGGIFRFTGSLKDGQIIVDAGPKDQVLIELNGVDIHCENSAPIWIRNADKVEIKLKKDKENKLSDGAVYDIGDGTEKDPDACIYARTDLKIKGKLGSLVVEAHHKHGINTCDDLKIKSGKIKVTAPSSALRGKDSVEIKAGDLELIAGKNGIYSRGPVHLNGGTTRIWSDKYGIFGFEEITAEKKAEIMIEKSLSSCASRGTIEERLLKATVHGKDLEKAEAAAEPDQEEE